jgi:hypothetical protein
VYMVKLHAALLAAAPNQLFVYNCAQTQPTPYLHGRPAEKSAPQALISCPAVVSWLFGVYFHTLDSF